MIGKAAGNSHQVALGMAIGFFIGWLPIIGIQMIVSIAVCKIFNANKVVPLFPVWLTNPVTLVPIYSFNYWIGWKVVGGPPLRDITAVLKGMIPPPTESQDAVLAKYLIDIICNWWISVRHGFSQLMAMGWEMQLPLWLGCIIVGLALALPSYWLTRKLVDSFREEVKKKVHARRERHRRERLLELSGAPIAAGPGKN